MNRLKRIWSHLNPIHVTILGTAILVLIGSMAVAALGFEPAGYLALPALLVITWYWWGGAIDLIDDGGD